MTSEEKDAEIAFLTAEVHKLFKLLMRQCIVSVLSSTMQGTNSSMLTEEVQQWWEDVKKMYGEEEIEQFMQRTLTQIQNQKKEGN